jgi:hypothetical protein
MMIEVGILFYFATACSLIGSYRRFGGTCRLCIQGMFDEVNRDMLLLNGGTHCKTMHHNSENHSPQEQNV